MIDHRETNFEFNNSSNSRMTSLWAHVNLFISSNETDGQNITSTPTQTPTQKVKKLICAVEFPGNWLELGISGNDLSSSTIWAFQISIKFAGAEISNSGIQPIHTFLNSWMTSLWVHLNLLISSNESVEETRKTNVTRGKCVKTKFLKSNKI